MAASPFRMYGSRVFRMRTFDRQIAKSAIDLLAKLQSLAIRSSTGRSPMGFAKLLIGWALSMPLFAAIMAAWALSRGAAHSGFVEAVLGIGILLAIPSFLFALILGWPIMSGLAHLRPAWLVPFVAGLVFALIMWGLAALMLPDGWRGAGHALVGHAAMLGLVLGCLNLATAPSS